MCERTFQNKRRQIWILNHTSTDAVTQAAVRPAIIVIYLRLHVPVFPILRFNDVKFLSEMCYVLGK